MRCVIALLLAAAVLANAEWAPMQMTGTGHVITPKNTSFNYDYEGVEYLAKSTSDNYAVQAQMTRTSLVVFNLAQQQMVATANPAYTGVKSVAVREASGVIIAAYIYNYPVVSDGSETYPTASSIFVTVRDASGQQIASQDVKSMSAGTSKSLGNNDVKVTVGADATNAKPGSQVYQQVCPEVMTQTCTLEAKDGTKIVLADFCGGKIGYMAVTFPLCYQDANKLTGLASFDYCTDKNAAHQPASCAESLFEQKSSANAMVPLCNAWKPQMDNTMLGTCSANDNSKAGDLSLQTCILSNQQTASKVLDYCTQGTQACADAAAGNSAKVQMCNDFKTVNATCGTSQNSAVFQMCMEDMQKGDASGAKGNLLALCQDKTTATVQMCGAQAGNGGGGGAGDNGAAKGASCADIQGCNSKSGWGTCTLVDGYYTCFCNSGHQGDYCEVLASTSTWASPALLGGIAACVLVVAAIVAGIVIYRRRQQAATKSMETAARISNSYNNVQSTLQV